MREWKEGKIKSGTELDRGRVWVLTDDSDNVYARVTKYPWSHRYDFVNHIKQKSGTRSTLKMAKIAGGKS